MPSDFLATWAQSLYGERVVLVKFRPNGEVMHAEDVSWSIGSSSAPLPPRAKGSPFVGSTLDFLRDPIAELLRQHSIHGPIFRIRLGMQWATVIGGRAANRFTAESGYEVFSNETLFGSLIHDLGSPNNMVILEGDAHRAYRAVALPSYSRETMVQALPLVDDTLRAYLAPLADGSVMDVFPTMQRIVSLQLGLGMNNLSVEGRLDSLQRYMRYLMNARLAGVWPKATILLPSFRRARRESHAVVDDVVKRHQADAPGAGRAPGLIDRFLAAHAENPGLFPLAAVRSAAFAPFLAGQDTVAATVAFLLAELCARADLRKRVQADVDRLFANGSLDPSGFRHAKDLAATMRETLRRYPVAPFLPKTTRVEFEFGGYRVPAGETVYLFQTQPHFDPQIFQDPFTFDIDRPQPPPDVFTPYGAGPHKCIGADISELQVIANVATLMHLAEFDVTPSDYRLRINTMPVAPKGFTLRIRKRSSAWSEGS